jgi:hypothetical protein
MKSQPKTIEEQVKDALSDASYIAVGAANGFAGMGAAYGRIQVQDVAVLHSLLMIAAMDGDALRSSMEAALCQCGIVLGLPNEQPFRHKAPSGVRERMDALVYGIKNELIETASALDAVNNIEGLDPEDIAAAVLSARQQCILMAGRLLSALQKP